MPLLKHGDYTTEEKHKHSCAYAKKERIDEKASGRKTYAPSVAPYDTKDHLLASVVSLLADSNDTNKLTDTYLNKREALKLLQQDMKECKYLISLRERHGGDPSKYVEEYEKLKNKCTKLREELENHIEAMDRNRSVQETLERARKIARMVHSTDNTNDIVPSAISVKKSANNTEVSEFTQEKTVDHHSLHSAVATLLPTPMKDDIGLYETPLKEDN